MLKVTIGGVPEHFNLPWYLDLKNGNFKKQGVNLRWRDCHGGTGEMCEALRSKEIDLAVILTEGIVKDIADGNPSKIIQNYVSSPLIWGVHVAKDSNYHDIQDLKGKKAAISRLGSGSHLMAYVNAETLGWDLVKDLKFKIVNNLEGGIEALKSKQADYFLWEAFTTKPFVDDGTFRKLGNCPTPWPCFVIAATNSFIEKHSEVLDCILSIINETTGRFKTIPSIEEAIAKRYSQKVEDIKLWLRLTEWSQSIPKPETLLKVQEQLVNLEILKSPVGYNDLVYLKNE